MSNTKQTRAPKQLGDFGEGFVNYVLIKKGYEVAVVDHVGADLIAEKGGRLYAISVKTRNFKKGSKEGFSFYFEHDHIEKLKEFAKRFAKMTPVIAFVLSLEDDKTIEVLIIKTDDFEKDSSIFKKSSKGTITINLNTNKQPTINSNFVDYSLWENKCLGKKF